MLLSASVRFPWQVVLIFATAAIASAATWGLHGHQPSNEGPLLGDVSSGPAADVIRRDFPPRYSARLLAVAPHAAGPVARRRVTDRLRHMLREADPGARAAVVVDAPASLLAAEPKAVTLFALLPSTETTSQSLAARLADLLPRRSPILLVGPAVLANRFSEIAKEEVSSAERVALPLAFLIALFAFSSIVAATLPFLLGSVTLLLVNAVLAALTVFLTLDPFATTITSVLTLGLSIDFSLFMITRYRAELATGRPRDEALKVAHKTVGSAIAISSVAIAGALLALALVGMSSFTSMAVGGAAAVAITALAAILLLPSIVHLLGPRLERGSLPRRARVSSGWERLADRVTARPTSTLAIVSATLALLCLPALWLQWTPPSAQDLPMHDPARKDLEQMTRMFGPGAIGPLEVVTRADAGKIRQTMLQEPGIDVVLRPVRGESGWTLVRAVPGQSPTAPASRKTVRNLRDAFAGEPTTYVGGVSASSLDLSSRLEAGTVRVVAAMVAFVAIVLMIGLRSLLVPLKALVGTFLSVGATLGLLALLNLLEGSARPEMALIVPLCLTAILFGLSIDYEVFLLSRIREEALQEEEVREAVRRGMLASSRPIVLAALTLASVFAVLATSSLQVFRQFGLGVVIGVVIDATLVRGAFVPAITVLFGKWNWWLPGRPKRGIGRPARS